MAESENGWRVARCAGARFLGRDVTQHVARTTASWGDAPRRRSRLKSARTFHRPARIGKPLRLPLQRRAGRLTLPVFFGTVWPCGFQGRSIAILPDDAFSLD